MIKEKSKYLEHIQDNEQIIVMRKILDKVEKVLKHHVVECTDFLDPYQQRLSESILNRFTDISYYAEGGFDGAERKSLIIYPHYLDYYSVENPIAAVKIEGKFKFTEVNHRDYLGTVMGLGIKREKIGDITIHENYAYMIIHKDIIDYLILNLKKIGKETILVSQIDLWKVEKGIEKYKENIAIVSSYRLDVIISSALNVSRSISTEIIKSGKVKVNWQPILKPDYIVNEGDLISVRGSGRFKIHNLLGETKKGRFKVLVRQYI